MPTAVNPPTAPESKPAPTPSMALNDEKLGTKRKIVCFSGMTILFPLLSRIDLCPGIWYEDPLTAQIDFDGTIFMQDTGHILFDAHGCGSERREALDAQIKSGERSFRDVSEEMWGSLKVPFEDGFEVMEKTLEIDPTSSTSINFASTTISRLMLYLPV